MEINQLIAGGIYNLEFYTEFKVEVKCNVLSGELRLISFVNPEFLFTKW